MINYTRSSYYGLTYLLRIKGSVVPRSLAGTAVACIINWLIFEEIIPLPGTNSEDRSSGLIAHPYTFQVMGLIFGYLSVYRIQVSYLRYWEGVTMVKNMHSKWADACGQVIAFDRSKSSETDVTTDPFCVHIVRLFSQMSAMATMRLHVVDAGESLYFDAVEAATTSRLAPLQTKVSKSTKNLMGGSFSSRSSKVEPDEHKEKHHLNHLPVQAGESLSSVTALGNVHEVARKHNEHMVANKRGSCGSFSLHRSPTVAEKVHELSGGIAPAERRLLLKAPCPVFATAQRIQRAITTRLNAGGMCAPPPIVSRIFQEISNGLLAYNNATKMKEIPVPFAYVQLNAITLNLFNLILTPIAVATYTSELWLSLVTVAVTVMSFYSAFIVANEMEDPFGSEENDVPMLEYHEEFCASLVAIMTNGWLPEDQWMVPEGKWVRPRTIGKAANAFCDTIGRKNIRFTREARPEPTDSLINRAKANGSKGPKSGLKPFSFGLRRKATESKFPAVYGPQEGFPDGGVEMDKMAAVIQRSRRRKIAKAKGPSSGAGGSDAPPSPKLRPVAGPPSPGTAASKKAVAIAEQ